MKPYLVDVPVKINIWIRPECQRRQWEVIKQVRPSILFIQSDGGRTGSEWKKIRENRKMIDDGIDWDCSVYRLYEENNNGLYAMGTKMRKLIWSTVDRCIFLEDDQIPAVSFFRFCAELLEKYKDDTRIECVCGYNPLGTWEKSTCDYFFSRQGSIWGVATWKRIAIEDGNFTYFDDPYVMGLLKQRTRHNRTAWKRLNAFAKNGICDGHVPGGEFFREFDMYGQNRVQIVPKKNLISNIGVGGDSMHADNIKQLPKRMRKLFNSPVYEIIGEISHPSFVIPDVEFEKRRNNALIHDRPFFKFIYDVERAFIKIKNGEIKYVGKKLMQKMGNRSGRDLMER